MGQALVARNPKHVKRFYGRRHGHKLSARQAALLDDLLPRIEIRIDEIENGQPKICPPDKKLWLEIGFGGGEHLVAQAQANPSVALIGCEPFVNGVAKLLAQIDDQGPKNIRIYPEDARDLLAALGPSTIDRVFILFPDPWPKTRHHKRRFISEETVGEVLRILRPGGIVRFASDIDDYVDWALRHFHRQPGFVWRANSPKDWRIRPMDWPETRYERKAVRDGRTCAYLEFEKRR